MEVELGALTDGLERVLVRERERGMWETLMHALINNEHGSVFPSRRLVCQELSIGAEAHLQ